MLGAGQRNFRISIYNKLETNTSGNRTDALTLYATRRAGRKGISTPRELEIAKGFTGESNYIFTVLLDKNIDHTQIIICDGVTYSIAGVVHDSNQPARETFIYVNEIVGKTKSFLYHNGTTFVLSNYTGTNLYCIIRNLATGNVYALSTNAWIPYANGINQATTGIGFSTVGSNSVCYNNITTLPAVPLSFMFYQRLGFLCNKNDTLLGTVQANMLGDFNG